MPLVLEAISPILLVDTDQIYKCILHISSLYIHKHFLFLATISIYKTTLTTYTMRSFYYVRRQKAGTNDCIIITVSCSHTNFVSIKEINVFGSVRIKEF